MNLTKLFRISCRNSWILITIIKSCRILIIVLTSKHLYPKAIIMIIASQIRNNHKIKLKPANRCSINNKQTIKMLLWTILLEVNPQKYKRKVICNSKTAKNCLKINNSCRSSSSNNNNNKQMKMDIKEETEVNQLIQGISKICLIKQELILDKEKEFNNQNTKNNSCITYYLIRFLYYHYY